MVSVVLPAYNQAGLLPEAIESVLNQTYSDFELIVIDDGSTDDVAAVLGRYADHPKVRILTQANQKLPKALNNAFEFAAGEFLSWTSADNLMEPAQLERQVEFLLGRAGLTYPDEPDQGVSPEILDLVRQGRKIEAIKLFRAEHHGGLREAKEFIESLSG